MRSTAVKKRRGFSPEQPKLCPICLNPMRLEGEVWECVKHGEPKA